MEIDNSPSMSTASETGLSPSVTYLPNGQKSGMAAVIKRGVEALLDDGYEIALLFDQDGEPASSLLYDFSVWLDKINRSGKPARLSGRPYSMRSPLRH